MKKHQQIIRSVQEGDIKEIAAIEAASYPSEEAASEESIRKRAQTFPDCFWLLYEEDRLKGFINGMQTDMEDLSDEMYDHPEMYNSQGKWLMLFSVVTHPAFRGKGYAAELMKQVIRDAIDRECEGVVLTCKERLIPFYAQFGYQNEGISVSTHGDAVWYQMRLRVR